MLYSCSPLHTQKQPSVVTAVSEQKNVAKEPSSAVRRGRREDRGSTGLSVRASVRLQDQLSLGAAPALPAWVSTIPPVSEPPFPTLPQPIPDRMWPAWVWPIPMRTRPG